MVAVVVGGGGGGGGRRKLLQKKEKVPRGFVIVCTKTQFPVGGLQHRVPVGVPNLCTTGVVDGLAASLSPSFTTGFTPGFNRLHRGLRNSVTAGVQTGVFDWLATPLAHCFQTGLATGLDCAFFNPNQPG